MELGIYSFADVQRDPNSGALGSTADAMRNLREAHCASHGAMSNDRVRGKVL